jgi:hypothetical protein
MSEADNERDESAGLYVGWAELQRRVAPKVGRDRFRALIKEKMARAGFPPFDDEWEGWYWPKVRKWLDSRNEVATDGAVADVQFSEALDGPETFDAAPRKKTRLQDRPAQPAVLVRQAGVPRSDGVSRHLHSVATGRDR